MATRRTIPSTSSPSSSSSTTATPSQTATATQPPSSGPSNITPAVPAPIIFKLLAFTFAMVTLPIGTYFLTVHSLFKGNSSLAGGLAALIANFVLVGYVVVAYYDDQSERLEDEAEKRRVGKVE